MKRLFLLVVGLGLMMGCSHPEMTYSTEENDGVTFIKNLKLEYSDLKLIPELIFGDEESDVYFSRISQVLQLSNDEILVLDSDQNQIFVFDNQGDFLRKIGRKGQGPGELNNPFGIVETNDNFLIVADTGNARIESFDFKGNYLNSELVQEDSPGRMFISKDGTIYNHNATGRFGWKETSLFKSYNNKFKRIGEFGKLIVGENDYVTHFANINYIAQNSKHELITANRNNNVFCIYENEKVISKFSPFVDYKPIEVTMKNMADGSIHFNINTICFGMDVDSKDRIYAVNRVCAFEDLMNDFEGTRFVLDIFEPNGVQIAHIPLDQRSVSSLTIGNDDKIYLVNADDATVLRYRGIHGLGI